MPASRSPLAASWWLVLLLGTALGAVGCAPPAPRLARGPIEVTATPVTVRFEAPVTTAGTAWELCFEFDLPRDSDRAGGIQVVLLTRDGGRHVFEDVGHDRRGERLVCRTGRIPASPGPRTFEAVELRSDAAVHLRWLGGGPQ
jgi:hypothetical protein